MRRRVALIAALALAAPLGFAVQAQAATFTVGTTSDAATSCANPSSGTCSLRTLIGSVPAGSTIDVPANAANPYTLTQGELLIEQDLTIVGAGARTTNIEHSPSSATARVFDIQRNPNSGIAPNVSISGVEVSFGTTTSSGGNILNQGNLTLSEVLIDEGQTSGGSGAGIANVGGTLTLTHSLLENNFSFSSSGGGTAGAIDNTGSGTQLGHLTVDNSTLIDNTAQAGAGAIWSRCTRCTSTASITNSTITANDGGTTTTNAGGILAASTTTVSVQNSIVASNTVGGGSVFSNCSGAAQITSLGHNLETGSDCGFAAPGDLQNIDPLFLTGGLADNGGNTNTVALAADSPAVDAIPVGAAGCSGTDQRDVARAQGTACDIGAYESTQQTEGQRFTEILSSIPTGSTSISINWGDGSPLDTTGVFDPTTGAVTGTHTYIEAGLYHGRINFHDSDGNFSTAFDIKVDDAPLTSAGSSANPIAGVSFTGPVATFTDANPFGKVSDFSATVTWGDGTATPGVVSAGPSGGFVVTGPHTYAAAGTYPTTIAITDVDGASTTAHGTAIVGARPSQVVTGPPDVKGSATAGFAGSVNPDGAATIAHFEYGLDRRYVTPGGSGPQYDHSTPSQSVGSDFSSHSVSASVSGLVPNALYHVRLVATNAAGMTDGPDMTFTTQRAPAPGAPGLGKTFNVSSTDLC